MVRPETLPQRCSIDFDTLSFNQAKASKQYGRDGILTKNLFSLITDGAL